MATAQRPHLHRLLLRSSNFLASRVRSLPGRLSDWKLFLVELANFPLFHSRVFLALWSIGQFLTSWALYGSHIVVSIGVLRYTYRRVTEFLSAYLPGSWGVSFFPVHRTMFISLLVTLPIWGLAMSFITAAWFASTQIWTWFQEWRHTRNYYHRASDMDLQPLNEDGGGEPRCSAPSHRARRTVTPGWAIARSICWILLYMGYLSLAISGVYLLQTYELPGDHRYRTDVERANAEPRPQGYGSGEKIFIAAMFRNNEAVLPYWIKEMTKFIYYAGTEKVFVSIFESNSGDNSPSLLEEFDHRLGTMGVARRILTRDTTIPLPPGADRISRPRIEFLSAIRNRAMEPLVEKGGYDRVIFSNDIYIEAESVVELLKTRDGDWDFVCGLDFGYWGLYDQWVIRDKAGAIPSTNWPYFFEWTGLNAIMRDDPAPAFTCWNGIVAFKADPFLPIELRTPGRLLTSPLSRPLVSTHPAFPQPLDLSPAEMPPLRFRGGTEKEKCFTSELFNLPYDFRRQFDLQNIYVNPRVINAYVWEYYVWYKYLLRHWAVKWWMERVENGYQMQLSKIAAGGLDGLWRWDGGECHPVCVHPVISVRMN